MPCMPGRCPRGIFLCVVALAFLTACEQPETAHGTTYFDESLGWSFSVPPGWQVRPDAETDTVRSGGKELIEENLDIKINVLARPVLYLKFDHDNRFTSDVEPYDPASDGPYEELQRVEFEVVRQAIGKALASEGLVLRHRDEQLQIDGVSFAKMTMEILKQGGEDVFVTSVIFDGLIGDQGFAMSYTCRSQRRCGEIRDAILSSKFQRQ